MTTWIVLVTVCAGQLAMQCNSVILTNSFNEILECQTELGKVLSAAQEKDLIAFGGCHKVDVDVNLL